MEKVKVKTKEFKEEVEKKGVTAVKSDKGFQYKIELYDEWGSNAKRLEPFGADRFIEKGNVFLYNEKNGFKVPKPEDTKEYRKFCLEEIEQRIKKLKIKLDKIRNRTDKTGSSLLDTERELHIFNKHKDSYLLDGPGSYIIFDCDSAGGKPIYSFDRIGNFKLPVWKSLDRSFLNVPNEANIAEASDLLKENEDKNGKKDNSMFLLNVILSVILLITIMGMGYLLYKTNQIPLEVTEILAHVVDKLALVTENIGEYTNVLTNVSNSTITSEPVVPNLNIINK